MIQWTEEAKNLAYDMAEAGLLSNVASFRRLAGLFSDERHLAFIAHSEWEAKLLADNLAESAEDRKRKDAGIDDATFAASKPCRCDCGRDG